MEGIFIINNSMTNIPNTTFSTRSYYKPTPKFWRYIGDALLGLSGTITTIAILDDWQVWVQITSVLMGTVGKFLTNFFAEI